MKNKRSKISERIFFSLVILSVLLLAGCAMVQKIVSPFVPSKPETSQGAPPGPNPGQEMAVLKAEAPSPQPGQKAEEAIKAAPSPGTKDVQKTEQPAVGTPEDPIAAGSVVLNPSVAKEAKIIQGRLADLGIYKAVVDGIWGKGSQAALKKFKEKNSLSNPDKWDRETQLALFKKTSQGQDPIENGSVLLNLLAPKDAETIQDRLAALGFYKGLIDGIWGKGSQAALKAFKEKNGLKNPEKWDKETQLLLFKKTG